MKAKAAVFMGAEKDFEVREFDVVGAPAGYGRLELIASGVCGTDIHIHKGKLGGRPNSIIGHEFVGRITDISKEDSEKSGLAVGDVAIADIAIPCGECILCQNGDDANCTRFKTTSAGNVDDAPHFRGGYGEVNFTPITNLIKVPEDIDPIVASVFACPGPTAIHGVCLAQKAGLDLKKVNVAVVQGLGPVGTFSLMYLKRMGVKKVYAITAFVDEKRENLAKELGADRVFCIERDGNDFIKEELLKENGGIGIDLCVECSGAPVAVPFAMSVLRNRGVYIVPGQYSQSGAVEIQPQLITFKALQIFGSSQYSISDVKKYIEFLGNNKDLFPIIEKLATKYPVSKINEAIADAKKAKNVKTVLIKG